MPGPLPLAANVIVPLFGLDVLNSEFEMFTEISLLGAIVSALANVTEAANTAPRASTFNEFFIVLLDSASSEVPVVACCHLSLQTLPRNGDQWNISARHQDYVCNAHPCLSTHTAERFVCGINYLGHRKMVTMKENAEW